LGHIPVARHAQAGGTVERPGGNAHWLASGGSQNKLEPHSPQKPRRASAGRRYPASPKKPAASSARAQVGDAPATRSRSVPQRRAEGEDLVWVSGCVDSPIYTGNSGGGCGPRAVVWDRRRSLTSIAAELAGADVSLR
jgi:hypothetical protein